MVEILQIFFCNWLSNKISHTSIPLSFKHMWTVVYYRNIFVLWITDDDGQHGDEGTGGKWGDTDRDYTYEEVCIYWI